ncbi:MAG: spondin domain-containing protein [Enhygromyxa sp.]
MNRALMIFGGLVGALLPCGCSEVERENHSREFVVSVTNLTPQESLFDTGHFDTPDTEVRPGALGPGQSYRFDVVVWPGAQLQVITMLLESNDAFVAFPPGGVALWTPTGEPIEGNRTRDLMLFDAGTERNEPLGVGPSQPLRQPAPDTGEPEHGRITVISAAKDGASTGPEGVEFPGITEFVELHVVHLGGPDFRVVIRNVSPRDLLGRGSTGGEEGSGPALLSPGVFTVQPAARKLFEVGERASPQLERLVEDGEHGPLAEQLEFVRGVSSPLSGVVWAVHDGEVGLFATGSQASAGLERLVEDGRPQLLLEQLEQLEDAGEIERHGLAPADGAVIEPGATVEFRFHASPGAHLDFVTGYLAANDKFVAGRSTGVPLFDERGEPRTGELDWALGLFDAGTEVDEPPGLGANQFERQSRRNGGGPDENGLVREVHGEWMGTTYPRAEQIVSVRVGVSL